MADDPTDDYRDQLPEELDASGYVGQYTFPNNNRRRISGLIYAVTGLGCVAVYVADGSGGVLVNRGLLYGGLFLLALACYHFASGVTLRINETDALVAATKTVGFPVGHASAQLSWRGLHLTSHLAHPAVLGRRPADQAGPGAGRRCRRARWATTVEDNPEDWSALDK